MSSSMNPRISPEILDIIPGLDLTTLCLCPSLPSMTSVPARPSTTPAFSGLTELDILKAKHKWETCLPSGQFLRLTARL